MEAKKSVLAYSGKMKTGSTKSKLKAPKPKAEKVKKPVTTTEDKKPRKSKDRMDRVVSAREPAQDFAKPKNWNDAIPAWVRESSEKKPKRAEWAESKLQWRKETKKSQRSFSKNKERDYSETKPKRESAPSDARGGFHNTFDKAATYEWETRKSSWDPKSKKPGTGFEKSKTGYKGVGSAWDKSTTPRVATRTWDDVGDKPAKSPDTPKRAYTKSASAKSETAKTTPTKVAKEEYKKPKYIAPKPTWEKETEVIDKKKLVDPTK